MSQPKLTIALSHYDRHVPFFDGTVKVPQGLSLKALQVGQTGLLRDGSFRRRVPQLALAALRGQLSEDELCAEACAQIAASIGASSGANGVRSRL